MSLTIYPIHGCGCCPKSFLGIENDTNDPRRRNRYGKGYGFDTCCALYQQKAEGYIYTGPIIFNDPGIQGIVITAEPANLNAVLVNAAGEIIETPINNEPFFVRIEETQANSLLKLYAGIPEPVLGTTIEVLDKMLSMSCMAPRAPYDPSWADEDAQEIFGDGYIFYDILRFYINPKPENCTCERTCVDMHHNVSHNDQEQITFFNGCCERRCDHFHGWL